MIPQGSLEEGGEGEFSMVREFMFRGMRIQELKSMSIEDFARLCRNRERRALRRGFTEKEKKLLLNVRKNPGKFHKTHARDMVIIPELLGIKMGIHNGKEYTTLEIKPEHLGHRLGEFAPSRKMVKHSAPGFGATKSSKYVPLK
jgi:small subunit ribosomal protein S19